MEKMLIFGGAGSLGNELVKFYIHQYDIVIVSRDEAKHWEIINKFNRHNLKALICDVRDAQRVQEVLLQEKPQNIIIAQALKQVDVCEKFPEESIQTNIIGVSNIGNALRSLSLMKIFSPKLICFVSTDKACNPINVYGMCKSISEKLMFNLANHFDHADTRVAIVRYGNVLSSKGSIIPLLLKQSSDPEKTKFTLTHVDMTRFMMTLNEAVHLINSTLLCGNNGDLWVPKLPSMKILDLMTFFGKKYNKPIDIVGIRPGEKIHEVMLSLEEALRVDVRDNYFVFNKENEIKNNILKEYSSADYLFSYEALEKYMDNYLIEA
jgi:UDP-N-acetylglucosamine 4,6-dehydratase/5-epimerase